MQKENFENSLSELKKRAATRNSESYDSGLPVTEGAIVSFTGIETANKGTAMEYTNFVNEEGFIISDKHIGRRNNGLNLEGDTNLARTIAFAEELQAATEPIKAKIIKILTKKALYDGRETLNSYYIFERV